MTTKSQLDHLLGRLFVLTRFCFGKGSPVNIQLHPIYYSDGDNYAIHVDVFNKFYDEKLSNGSDELCHHKSFELYSFWDYERNLAVFNDIVKFAAWRPDGTQPHWLKYCDTEGK